MLFLLAFSACTVAPRGPVPPVVVVMPDDLTRVSAEPVAVLLLAGSWSEWTAHSRAILDQAAPALAEAGVSSWEVGLGNEDSQGWIPGPWDEDPSRQWYVGAKGASSPLLVLRDGREVGFVQFPWRLTPEELTAEVLDILR